MKFKNYTAILLLILITFAVFSSALLNGFVSLDDEAHVTNNPAISSITPYHICMLFSNSHVGLYIPVTMLSYMADYHFWGYDPFGYHLTNVCLHILAVILVFFFLLTLGLSRPVAFFVALIFAVHPVQVESVAWVSERKTLLSSVFFFLSFLAYIRYSKRGSVCSYLLSLFIFTLALLSKPSVVVLPFLLLGDDYFYGRGIRGKTLVDKVPFFLLSLFFSIVTICAHKYRVTGVFLHGDVISSHIATILPIFLNYLRLVFSPFNLSGLYGVQVYTSVFQTLPLVSLVILVSALCLLCYGAIKKKTFGFWIFWFFVLMLPVSNVIPYIHIYSDRYLYLSILAFPLLIYLTVSPHFKSALFLRRALMAAVIFVVICLGFLSYYRNKVWKNSFTFWYATLMVEPRTAGAHMGMGVAYAQAGDYDGAIKEFNIALAINPDYGSAMCNLAATYKKLGLITEAIEASRRAIKLNPNDRDAYINLAECYAKKGFTEEAISAYEKAFSFHYGSGSDYSGLSLAYLKDGQTDKAIEVAEKAVKISPNSAKAYNALGCAYVVKEEYENALRAFRSSCRINPAYREARENLKNLRSSLGADSVENADSR